MKTEERFRTYLETVRGFGASDAAVLPTDELVLDASFRDLCARNACGKYGKCYTCPPDCGAIEDLMAKLRRFDYALFFQTVGQLEDSFDVEGMEDAAKRHAEVTAKIRDILVKNELPDSLLLGAGGCRICPICAKETGEPCRHPDLALSSLEAHGVFVAECVEKCGMKYINGKDTVTYFGALFFYERGTR